MKRQDALRKVQIMCRRLDEIDSNTFPIWPLKLYLFGSVLTDKPDPGDTDMVLVYRKNPNIEYSDAEISRMIFYEPRLQPQIRASVQLRHGMKKVQLYTVPTSIAGWEYLPLFPNGEGLQLIWKPGLNWSAIVGEIESNPTSWQGPRPVDAEQRVTEEWKALPEEERQARIAQTLRLLNKQEEDLAMKVATTKPNDVLGQLKE